MTKLELEEAVAELPTEEQIDLLGRLWDKLAAEPENLGPLSSEDRAVLDQRLAEHEADPAGTVSVEATLASFAADELALACRRRA